jgi:hypothetical protein
LTSSLEGSRASSRSCGHQPGPDPSRRSLFRKSWRPPRVQAVQPLELGERDHARRLRAPLARGRGALLGGVSTTCHWRASSLEPSWCDCGQGCEVNSSAPFMRRPLARESLLYRLLFTFQRRRVVTAFEPVVARHSCESRDGPPSSRPAFQRPLSHRLPLRCPCAGRVLLPPTNYATRGQTQEN